MVRGNNVKTSMKTLLLVIALLGTLYASYPKSYQNNTITLLGAFQDMANTSVPALPLKKVSSINLTKYYNIKNHSVITSGRLDEELEGVLKGKGQKFITEARKNNICPIFLAAVSMHESNNGKSDFAKNRNNVFGIYLKGKYHKFDSVDKCIEYSAKLLSGSLYSKNPTILGVQRVYCPIGAKNDPKGINKYWLSGVMSKMKKLWGDSIYVTS